MLSHIPNIDLIQTRFGVLLNVDIYGEMCVDITHLVFEAPRNANNKVVDNRLDCPQSGDVLAGTVVELDVDQVLRRMREGDS